MAPHFHGATDWRCSLLQNGKCHLCHGNWSCKEKHNLEKSAAEAHHRPGNNVEPSLDVCMTFHRLLHDWIFVSPDFDDSYRNSLWDLSWFCFPFVCFVCGLLALLLLLFLFFLLLLVSLSWWTSSCLFLFSFFSLLMKSSSKKKKICM